MVGNYFDNKETFNENSFVVRITIFSQCHSVLITISTKTIAIAIKSSRKSSASFRSDWLKDITNFCNESNEGENNNATRSAVLIKNKFIYWKTIAESERKSDIDSKKKIIYRALWAIPPPIHPSRRKRIKRLCQFE